MATEVSMIRRENDLRVVFNDFKMVKGVTAVALVGRDGFVIESMANGSMDMEALGAMVATAIGTSETLGAEFELGTMDQYLAEFKHGKVLMAAVNDDILAVVTDTSAVIGAVRYAIRKNLPNVLKAI